MTTEPASSTAFDAAVEAVRSGARAHDEARSLYALMTEGERLGLLDGDTPVATGLPELMHGAFTERPFVHGAVPRLGVPGLVFSDGPRGCVIGAATAFPVAMARGATFDIELEEAVGDVIGREVRAAGANLYGGVCVNLPRHPAWGRSQETYGDEPLHVGEMGAALTRGAQRHVMATVKHLALNSMENARFRVDVTVDDSTLHDVYLPHFKRVVDEGVAAVMSAYNMVNGSWCGESHALLHDVLRERWGFDGVVVSDWVMGFRNSVASLQAGLDVEMPFAQRRAAELPVALEDGTVDWPLVERAGVRSLAAQLRNYATRSAGPHTERATDAARALARTVAARSAVLLKNDRVDGLPLLPLDASAVVRVAVIGRLAVTPNLGDHGSSDVKHVPAISTPLEGISAAFPNAHVTLVEADDPEAAAHAAASADVAVVVVGYTAQDEGEHIPLDNIAPEGTTSTERYGEGGDRRSLRLRAVDEAIISAVAAANRRTVVVVVAGGAVVMDPWQADVPALLLTWYAGMEGGHALGDVLTGAVDPSGRLPFAVPVDELDLPPFDADAEFVTYTRLHGQRHLDAVGVPAAFPFGYGLSYTGFALDEAAVIAGSNSGGTVRVRVRNTGLRKGRHVVQLYGARSTGAGAGERWLLGFAPVELEAGREIDLEVAFSLLPLARWSAAAGQRVLPDPAGVVLEAASFAHDPAAVHISLAQLDAATPVHGRALERTR